MAEAHAKERLAGAAELERAEKIARRLVRAAESATRLQRVRPGLWVDIAVIAGRLIDTLAATHLDPALEPVRGGITAAVQALSVLALREAPSASGARA